MSLSDFVGMFCAAIAAGSLAKVFVHDANDSALLAVELVLAVYSYKLGYWTDKDEL